MLCRPCLFFFWNSFANSENAQAFTCSLSIGFIVRTTCNLTGKEKLARDTKLKKIKGWDYCTRMHRFLRRPPLLFRSSVWPACTTQQVPTTTPNIFGPTMLWLVASVCIGHYFSVQCLLQRGEWILFCCIVSLSQFLASFCEIILPVRIHL